MGGRESAGASGASPRASPAPGERRGRLSRWAAEEACAPGARARGRARAGGADGYWATAPPGSGVLAEPAAGCTRYFPPVQSPSGPCLLVTSASSSVIGALVAGTGAALGGAGPPGKLRPVSGFQCRRPLVSRSARERGPGPCCPPGCAREASGRPACAGLRHPC